MSHHQRIELSTFIKMPLYNRSVGANSITGIFLTDFNSGNPGMHQRALGAYHMANVLRGRGCHAQVIDFIYSMGKSELDTLVDIYVSDCTKFIGISTTFMYSKLSTLNFDKPFTDDDPVSYFINKAKTVNPNILVVQGGGYHFNKHPLADVLMPGQYVENQFINFLNKRYQLTMTANYNFPTHEMGFEDWDFILHKETLPLEVSRGCIFSCKFCAFSGRGKKINDNIKSYDLIRKFLGDSYKKFSTTNYYLADDTFNESEKKLIEFRTIVNTLDFKPSFVSYIRLDLLIRYPMMITILKEIGIRAISFGIETLSPTAGKTIGKGTNPVAIKEFLIELRHSHPDLYLSSGFIVGLPGESESEIFHTNQWLIRERVLDSWHFAPLILDNYLVNPNPSEFSKSIEKYDYKRVGPLGWDRGDLSFEKACTISTLINNENRTISGPSPWTLFGLLRAWEFDKIKNIKNQNLKNYLDNNKVSLYKEFLFNFNNHK